LLLREITRFDMFWCCCGDSANNASQVNIPKPDLNSEKTALQNVQAQLDAAEEAEHAGAAFAGNVPAAAASAFKEEAVTVAVPPPEEAPEQPAKSPSPAKSHDASRNFTVNLEVTRSEDIGCLLDATDEQRSAVVREVREGALKRWNQTCSPGCVVESHDRIITLNGKKIEGGVLADSLGQLSGKCTLEVQRPRLVKAKFKKPGQLGVNMLYKKSSHGIVVNQVLTEGLVHKWNVANPKDAIHSGDRIVGVNGNMMDAQLVIKTIKESDEYELMIMHYSK